MTDPIDPAWIASHLTDAQRAATTQAYLSSVAKTIDQRLNGDRTGPDRATGFVLLAFPFGAEDGRRVNYVSNAERADMLVALKEIVARFEGRVVETDTKQ